MENNKKTGTERIKALAIERITDLIMDNPLRTWELLNSMHNAMTERMYKSSSELDHEILWFINTVNENLTLVMLSQSDYSSKLIESLKDSLLSRLNEPAV